MCHRHHACAPKGIETAQSSYDRLSYGSIEQKKRNITVKQVAEERRQTTPGEAPTVASFRYCAVRYDIVYLFPPTSAHFNYTPICSRLRTDPLPREISLEQGADEACLAHAVLPDNEYHGFGLEIRRIHGRRVEVGVAAGLLEG